MIWQPESGPQNGVIIGLMSDKGKYGTLGNSDRKILIVIAVDERLDHMV